MAAMSELFLHEKQMEVYKAKSRFKVVVAGRRFGKTQLSKIMMIRYARVKNRLIWYVAPSYRMAKQIMWPDLVASLPKKWVKKINETTMTIVLVNNTRIELKGADNPDSLRGVGIHYLVMDEVQNIDPEAWTKVLRPTLASTGGHALFIGCVHGKTRVLTDDGIREIESMSVSKEPKTLEPIDCNLYGINRSFHRANGFWNNGVVATKKIRTNKGFAIEASHVHPIMVQGKDGIPVWKRSDQSVVGDRVAIARGMDVWGDKDPFDGYDEHASEWIKQYEGKQGGQIVRIENNAND